MRHPVPRTIFRIVAKSSLITGMLLIATAHSGAGEYKSVCYDEDKYQVFARDRYANVGMDIFFRVKRNNIDTDNCDWDRRKGDVWISENKGKYSEDAMYVIGVRNDFVLMDLGTAADPERNFAVYDMKSRKQVLDKNVSEQVVIADGSVTLWIQAGSSNADNCPNRKELEGEVRQSENASGATFRLTRKHLFDLKTGTLRSTQETKCYIV
ncbi:hypothetical protein ACQKQD_30000 [Methylobacterium sp. NPDC080182]|uniref:hypothetical protein n=1 Tax=Methylobacterium sp. NPDC080182 TaxID=3390590 RepID=UPI003D0887FC